MSNALTARVLEARAQTLRKIDDLHAALGAAR